MNREKALARIAAGIVVVAGAGVLAVSGMLLDVAHKRATRAEAVDFAASSGLGTALAELDSLERGAILEAFGAMKQGKAQAFVLRIETQGYSGKARFLCAFGADGSLKASAPTALTDAWPLVNEWPGVAVCRELMQEGGRPMSASVGVGSRSWDAETQIFLSNLGDALNKGQAAVIRNRRAVK